MAEAAPLDKLQPMLIIFGGLSGIGKTTVARELARQLGAVYLRIDSIEQAIRDSGAVKQPVVKQPVNENDAGYRVGYAVAEDNLRLGLTVVADSVNPLQLTRDAWIGVVNRAHVNAFEVEAVCSDSEQHQLRVETRVSDIEGLRLPTWQEVVSREYEPWDRPHILIDTTTHSVAENVKRIREALSNHSIC
jgi:predicted kinase